MRISRFHLITPDATDVSVIERTRLAVGAGARWIQVRTKQGTDRQRLAFAGEIMGVTAPADATVVIDDRVDIALAAGAGGVHVGADDLPVAVVRHLLGSPMIVGATCRTPEAARRRIDEGATYLGVGPVHLTSTKVGLPEPIGLAGLEAVCRVAEVTGVPVIAISGITVERVAGILDAGAHGVAVVSAVYDARDVAAATRSFLEVLPDGLDECPPVDRGAPPAVRGSR